MEKKLASPVTDSSELRRCEFGVPGNVSSEIPGGQDFDLVEEFKRIPDRMFFRIGEVAEIIQVKPYVLRYWESEFKMISPQKSSSGQRVYRRTDVETVILIKHLLYSERYSIEGAVKKIRELRRGGNLKRLRSPGAPVTDTTPVIPVGVPETVKKPILAQANELLDLVKTPLSGFFRY